MPPAKILVAVLTAFAVAASCGAAAQTAKGAANVGEGQPVPLPDGPAAQVTNEHGYQAFPITVPTADGALLTAYRAGSGHATSDGKVRLRRSIDGDTWTEWNELATGPGYAHNPTGLASETAAQGGRLYMAVVRYTTTGPTSVTDFRSHLTRSDDAGRTWTDLVRLPEPVTGGTYPSGIIVTTDGTVIVSAYVKNATGRWSSHYWRSTDRGDTWTPFGVLAHASRNFQEPQLVQLDDGRILTALRSDSAGQYYDYIYTATTQPGAADWTTPVATVVHATGNPQMTKLPSGHVVLTYRGYGQLSESSTPNTYPPRVAMLRSDGSLAYRGNIDVLAGEDRRYLYGNLVPVVGGYRLVAALESSAAAAGLYSVPVRFGVIPPW